MSSGLRTLVIACGALGRELRAVLGQLDDVVVHLLPSALHNRPDRIPAAVEKAMTEKAHGYDRVVVGYADCGTGGLLDRLLADHPGVERLPGAHCYEFFAGGDVFASLHDDEPGTFYLTDYLALHFEQLVWVGLGLDRFPQLRDQYFGNYRRIVLLSQQGGAHVIEAGREAADRLGLAFEHRHTGLDPFESVLLPLLEVSS